MGRSDSIRQRPFSVSSFQVQLDLLMATPAASEHFTHYLRRSHNLDGYLFLQNLKRMKDPQTPNEVKAQMIIDIYKDFICVGSDQEVNIDKTTRLRVEEKLVESKQLENPNVLLVTQDVFYPVEMVVTRELREDALARYIRSEDFLEWISNKGEEFLRCIAIDATLQGRQELIFRPSDFENTSITDKDIAFVLRLNEDSPDWIPLRRTKKTDLQEKDHYAYISRSSYSVGESMDGLHLSKFTGYLPYSAEQAIQAMTRIDTSQMYDHNQTLWHSVEYIQEDPTNPQRQFSMVFSYWQCNLGIPLHKNRHCIQLSTVVYDSVRKCYIWVGRTTRKFNQNIANVFHSTSQRKKMIQCDFLYGYTVYKVSENRCRYVHAVYADAKIKMGLTMFKLVMKKRDKGIHNGFLAVCEESKKTNFERTDKDGGLMRTLDEFMARYLPNEDSVKTWEI